MSNMLAGLVCATGLWIIGGVAATTSPSRPPSAEAWTVTSSERMASRPILVRIARPARFAKAGGETRIAIASK